MSTTQLGIIPPYYGGNVNAPPGFRFMDPMLALATAAEYASKLNNNDDSDDVVVASAVSEAKTTIVPNPFPTKKKKRKSLAGKRKRRDADSDKKAVVPTVRNNKQRLLRDSLSSFDKAAEARRARWNRRRLRALNQAVNLVGGGDVSSIRRRAVEDATSHPASSEYPSLLADFSRHFNPRLYVHLTFEHVYEAMKEASEADESVEDALLSASSSSSTARSGDVEWLGRSPDRMPTWSMEVAADSADDDYGARTMKQATSGGANDHPAETFPPKTSSVPTAKCRINSNNKSSSPQLPLMLPAGKDLESKKQRRLMRNRASAQASRDRRKKAIEDAQRSKAAKEREIEVLERTVKEATQRMMLLEKAIKFAREYLGPEKYAKVAAASSELKGGDGVLSR